MFSFPVTPVGCKISEERADGGCFVLLLGFNWSFIGVVLTDGNEPEAVGLLPMSPDIRVTWPAPRSRLACPGIVVSGLAIAAKPASGFTGD